MPRFLCPEQENLQEWMLDTRGRDQFVIRYRDQTEIYWNDAARSQVRSCKARRRVTSKATVTSRVSNMVLARVTVTVRVRFMVRVRAQGQTRLQHVTPMRRRCLPAASQIPSDIARSLVGAWPKLHIVKVESKSSAPSLLPATSRCTNSGSCKAQVHGRVGSWACQQSLSLNVIGCLC